MGIKTLLSNRRGFALPTVLIASVVLMIILATAVTATTAARNTLKDQYYAQLAQIAGEAGVAMATACLQANNNTVTWSDANPLTPATNCSGVVSGGVSCPSDAQCWVMVQDNIRTSFSVPAPEVDGDGRPVLIEQAGYVELWRESTNTAWRTYRQPAVQSAVVPALCSGSARSDLGWANAVKTTPTGSFGATTASPISISASAINPGPIQLRKDFNIAEAGNYTITAKGDDKLSLYLDGALIVQTSSNTSGTITVPLSTGCHVLHATVTNFGIQTGDSNLILSMKKQGGSQEVVVTDNSWRASGGVATSYSQSGYYTSSTWTDARDISAYNAGTPMAAPSDWATVTGDTTARWISSNTGYSGNNYPSDPSYTYFRSKSVRNWTFTAATEVRFSIACDDRCTLYLDGNALLTADQPGTLGVTHATLSPGQHSIGLELTNYNGTTTPNPAGFLFSAQRTSDNVVLDRSTAANWYAANAWYNTQQTLASYETTFYPSPDFTSCDCATQGMTNFIPNPSFETNTTGYSGTLTTLTRTSAAARYGSNGLRVTVSTLGVAPRAVISTTDIEPGRKYVLTTSMKSTTNVRLGYQFKDVMGNVIPVGGADTQFSTATNTAGAWATINLATVAVPANTVTMDVWLAGADNAAVSTTFDVDGLMLAPGATTYQYRDGTNTDWRWLGTAHGSISSGPATL